MALARMPKKLFFPDTQTSCGMGQRGGIGLGRLAACWAALAANHVGTMWLND